LKNRKKVHVVVISFFDRRFVRASSRRVRLFEQSSSAPGFGRITRDRQSLGQHPKIFDRKDSTM
jgi:hypothetical protein